MCNCKVMVNECVANQEVKKQAFRQEVTRILGDKKGLLNEWNKTAELLRKTVETVLEVIFKKTKWRQGDMVVE